jgi:uncharacterized protein YfiM (DUF2279 family)
MKRIMLSLGGAALVAVLAASPARADTASFDKAMQPVLTQYLTIHKALSGDTVKGVAKAAKKLASLTKALKPKRVTGKHAKHYATLPAKLKAAAQKVAKAKGIKAQREAYKALSRPMALWATMSKPAGVNVVFCSMAKGSWLQRTKAIRNPYYGAKMLTCGQVIGGKHRGHADGHMK